MFILPSCSTCLHTQTLYTSGQTIQLVQPRFPFLVSPVSVLLVSGHCHAQASLKHPSTHCISWYSEPVGRWLLEPGWASCTQEREKQEGVGASSSEEGVVGVGRPSRIVSWSGQPSRHQPIGHKVTNYKEKKFPPHFDGRPKGIQQRGLLAVALDRHLQVSQG